MSRYNADETDYQRDIERSVEKLVDLINDLRGDNEKLASDLLKAEERIEELKETIEEHYQLIPELRL